ncbi:hypothetical protein HDU82_006408 [Entophlyctis luteolus]|nr:hypothetical protein HDU82_006408 [Entophlyctis luteolus]
MTKATAIAYAVTLATSALVAADVKCAPRVTTSVFPAASSTVIANTATSSTAASIPSSTTTSASTAISSSVVPFVSSSTSFSSVLAAATTTTNSPSSTASYRAFTTPGLVGYWANWSPAAASIDEIDLTGVQTLIYAFMQVAGDGSLATTSAAADQKWIPIINGPIKNKYPELRTVLSVGGWSLSGTFSNVAKSSTAIAAFASNVKTFLDQNGFDGIDLDWEYPGGGGFCTNAVDANDVANYVTLLSALRTALGPDRHISIAMAASPDRYTMAGKSYLADYAAQASYFGIMTYDIYGTWNAYSDYVDPQASVGDPNGSNSIQTFWNAWTATGIPMSKMVSGVGFYGNAFSVLLNTNNGVYQVCNSSANAAAYPSGPFSSCPPVPGESDVYSSGDSCTPAGYIASWTYLSLRTISNGPLTGGPATASNGWTRMYDSSAQMASLFTPQYNGLTNYVITYDDTTSIQNKVHLAKSSGFAGVMIWQLGNDYNSELLTAAVSGWSQ